MRSVRSLLAVTPIVLLVAASPANAAVAHTVQPGETLWSIAAANNLTTRTVAAFNGLSEDAQVVLGSTINVPTTVEGAAALQNAGVLYLQHLLRETGGDENSAIAGYYQGLGSVRSRGLFDDTQRYVANVQALRSRFGG